MSSDDRVKLNIYSLIKRVLFQHKLIQVAYSGFFSLRSPFAHQIFVLNLAFHFCPLVNVMLPPSFNGNSVSQQGNNSTFPAQW